MKRAIDFVPANALRLELPLAELKILLGDDEHLVEWIGTDLMACNHCSILHPHSNEADIFVDEDNCLILAEPCPLCGQGKAIAFIDTTDLPEWQQILRHLIGQQFGMNSFGDE